MLVSKLDWQEEIVTMCDLPSKGETRAMGHNYRFDELVSDRRRTEFESFIPETPATDLRSHHVDYWQERCRNALVPATFLASNDPAAPDDVSDDLTVARLENIDWILANAGKTFQELLDAKNSGNNAVLEDFIRKWNSARDHRPHFAAVFDDIKDELDYPDWPDRLRDRLGLAHYSAISKSIPVALMVYRLGDLTRKPDPDVVKMTSPTVLDSEPWPYFYPAPQGICYGRAMTLGTDHDESALQAELLHPRGDYKVRHLFKLGEVTTPARTAPIEELRNHHLLCLRIATGKVDFGCEL